MITIGRDIIDIMYFINYIAIPFGKLIILDLASEISALYRKTNAYYGHPFIWNMLENFGGTTRLFGNFDIITKRKSCIVSLIIINRLD